MEKAKTNQKIKQFGLDLNLFRDIELTDLFSRL